jgi:hypothetical protein
MPQAIPATEAAMSANLTERESDLAARLGKLRDASARPKIENGGMIGETLNFISAHVRRC